ncbi:DsbA family protein [Temperatibacter marinus]|uniref:DsbA family protein n=1 Tax=Temperatibacter marinus TaxID=1456591 RepID=A0AA52HAF1_9PROT|nr:DsbA family protein [Temperatibacter marinus]WND02675.1 DsbA family protein [Temperatibacter marinus]
MSLKKTLRPFGAEWITSSFKLGLERRLQEWKRKLTGKEHELLYFHRADDPYCQLMVQILPELAQRFQVTIRPKVLERLPGSMYPDPIRFEAYSIVDASRVAKLYGLGFPADATVPDVLSTGMVNRQLASIQDKPDFFAVAEELGALLWRRSVSRIQEKCSVALVEEETLRANERLLISLGHYASGSLYYAGEWYTGIDRLDHLEQRFNSLLIGDGEVHYDLQRLWRYGLRRSKVSSASGVIDFYFSLRSPYSYLALEQLAALSAETGVKLNLKPVLPMVARGLKVPDTKKFYIVKDAKREALQHDIAFGRFADPLGKAVHYGLAIGQYLSTIDRGKELAFYRVFFRSVMAEGIDASTDKGLQKITEKSGISLAIVRDALQQQEWQEALEENRKEILQYGCWGVPVMRANGKTFWGQDRIWALAEALGEKTPT